MLINLIYIFPVWRKLMTFRFLRDTSLERTFNSIPCKIIGTLLIAGARKCSRFSGTQFG